MKKITKAQLKAMAARLPEVTVHLFPSNRTPEKDSGYEVTVFMQDEVLHYSPIYNVSVSLPFDVFLKGFETRRCNHENGKRIHYYIGGFTDGI